MPITDATLNGFARSLSARIAERASGQDADSARIVGMRPSDHVLTGFLTPAAVNDRADEEADDDRVANDLPQDSPYEQTAVGFEWLLPRPALQPGVKIAVTLQLNVYVRRLPSFAEQSRHSGWQVARRRPARPANGPDGSDEGRSVPLQEVWTREGPNVPLACEIDIGELQRLRTVTVDLAPALHATLALGDDLVPLRPPRVPESALGDEATFQSWLAGLPRDGHAPRWRPVIDARVSVVPTEPDALRIALRLINRTPSTRTIARLDHLDPNLYAVTLEARFPRYAHRPTTFRELPQSYRYDRRMPAVGINCHAHAATEGEAVLLAADTVPRSEVARLEPRRLDGPGPTFDALARDPLAVLRNIHAAMGAYDARDWAAKLASLTGAEFAEASEDRGYFGREIADFGRGIDLLADHRYPAVARAFRLMNEVMATLGRTATRPYEEWRLFQIVFVVSQLPLLAGREYPELRRPEDDRVDLLWFAAGGGKTEAFQGLIIWQAFFDRLRGKRLGVTAFVRFPLRLLTFQQLQRLSRVLGIAELVRAREALGGARFSLGYFVGGTVTDNRIDDDAHQRYSAHGVDERQKRLFQCPFCLGATRLRYDEQLRLIEHYCQRSACPGGRDRLPVYIVDDDLYRYLPTVIVSTVDKLAMLGQNQRFANLLGRIDMVCPRHGASFLDSNAARCPAARQRAEGVRPVDCAQERVLYGPFKELGPALLVQDELHLLSEELGTFDAHYETAAAQMSRSLDQQPWKVIAATATIQEYGHHTWQLYLKPARQFPSPGPGAYDSFYYALNPDRIGRIFVGLVGIGRKHTPAVTKALAIVYLELEEARRLAERDPGAAARRYATGQLSPDAWRQLLFLYELPLTYALTRKGSDQVAEGIESKVKKELQELAPAYGDLMIQMFNGGVDVSEMIESMDVIRAARSDTDPSRRIRGVVATNIIGHGVDVDRFNIMVFAGFPRLVAEYIQASARVGRTFPGLSIFVATPQSERDRGVFNRFAKFHEYLDRLVDPSAIVRWPLPPLERTVPGILSGYLMGVAATKVGTRLATVEQVQRQLGRLGAEALTADAMAAWVREAYGAALAPSAEQYGARLEATAKRWFATIVNTIGRAGTQTALNTQLGAMRNLRDVDDPADIRVDDPLDSDILRRLIRGDV